MALGRGAEELICSYRGCISPAQYALSWSNPALHFGREKHWLACGEHREELERYFKYRDFPVRRQTLAEFLAENEDPRQGKRTGVPSESQPGPGRSHPTDPRPRREEAEPGRDAAPPPPPGRG